ncbi:DUF6385 domain-containing protein [Desulfofalx alkaliphila]|uniref:DUF6385 domain-containing protein n=1 Tax=Desulfofalx alkaliphila TaxID=105483 RepID=UPI00068FCF6E|nr:DUF6385 domain-containing protein [Desulfofalx alkaliphila]
MPNFSVFNFDPDRLRVKIFGSEDVPIKTDSDGNLDIRDLSEAQDSILIYGFDGTENVAIRTDDEGRLDIRGLSEAQDSILIYGFDGTENVAIRTDDEGRLDIRGLSEARDSILIYGFDGNENVAIKTDEEGRLEIAGISEPITAITTPNFNEEVYTEVVTADDFTGLEYEDTATQTVYSYFVYNSGDNDAEVRLDVSANGADNIYFIDVEPRVIASGETDVFVPNTFLRYTRLSYRSANADEDTTLDIYFQTQSS